VGEERVVAAIILDPGSSILHKTGGWRSSRPVHNKSKCNMCGLCWAFCPEGAIRMERDFTIDLDYCKGCGICAKECPAAAITMVEEK
jgi:pyruvate ferredoxin oxidoreductase delta subunit